MIFVGVLFMADFIILFVYNKLNRQFVGGIQTQNFVQVNERTIYNLSRHYQFLVISSRIKED